MREIKFRVWNKNGFYLHQYDGTEQTGLYIVSPFNTLYSSPANSSELLFEQFTGILDKNDKEVYEGDIVQFKTPFHYRPIMDSVYFSEGQWEMKESCYSLFECQWSGEEKVLEVIGNIHNNTNLLKL